jgi:hypothetical protein
VNYDEYAARLVRIDPLTGEALEIHERLGQLSVTAAHFRGGRLVLGWCSLAFAGRRGPVLDSSSFGKRSERSHVGARLWGRAAGGRHLR